MKKSCYLGLVLAVALSSCRNEDLGHSIGRNQIKAVIETNDSRVAFDDDGVFSWTEGDVISITTTTSDNTFGSAALTSGQGTGSGTFEGVEIAETGYAVYPYHENHKIDGTSLTYHFPESYDYTQLDNDYVVAEGKGNSYNMPMWGKLENGHVSFKHLGGVICFKVNQLLPVSDKLQFVFTSAKYRITGDYIVSVSTGTPEIEAEEASTGNSITINFSNSVENGTGVFYFPVPTGTYDDFTVSLVNDGENVFSLPYSKNLIIDRKYVRRTVIGKNSVDADGEVIGEIEVMIGDQGYVTLQAALDAVKDGETITLESDVKVTEAANGQNALNYARTANFTLDLNGKSIYADTGNSVFRFNINGSGATSDVTVTMKNGTVTSGDNTWCTVMASGIDNAKAVFNLENLTINASKAGDLAVKAWGNSVVNVKDVTVNATRGAGGFYAVGGEMVLDNCTVNQQGLHTAPYNSMAVAVSNGGKLTVNSGNYKAEPTAASEGNNQGTSHGNYAAGVMSSGGTLIINGGTFANGNYGDDALATAARGLIFGDTAAEIEINDGTFNALKSIIEYQNNLGGQSPRFVIKGGDFSADPSDVTPSNSIEFAEGKAPAQGENGRWTLVDAVSTPEALSEAFANGGTITLGSDITITEEVEIPAGKTVTLNLNGKTISAGYQEGSTEKHIYPINNKGNLTITGGTIEGRGIYNQDGATLTINGATVKALDYNGGACVWSYGTGEVYLNNATMIGNTGVVSSEGYLEINGGTYTCYSGISEDGTQITAPTYNIRAYNGLKITDGTFTSRHGVISVGGGEAVIEGGSYTLQFASATTSNVVYVYGSTDMTINGGEFISDNTSGKADSGAAVSVSGSDAKASIYDGTFIGMNGMVSGNATLYGGTYDTVWDYNHYDKLEDKIADGYTATQNTDGSWSISKKAE